MDTGLEQKMEHAVWVAATLFQRQRATGSSANLSFLHKGSIYISGSGTCFGRLTPDSFAKVGADGGVIGDTQPSKELPLHRLLYQKDDRIQAVLHTHSYYSTLWSCLEHGNPDDVLPGYTPYLQMKLGAVRLVPYGPPGSEALFTAFSRRLDHHADGYLLAHHGPVVGAADILSAFYALEELEESAHIAWDLRSQNARIITNQPPPA